MRQLRTLCTTLALACGILAGTSPALAAFPMRVTVAPNPMPYDARPVLTVYAPRGAVCTAIVHYSTGRRPVSFRAVTLTSTGTAAWRWHEETKGTSGAGVVTCTYQHVVQRRRAPFTVTHR